MPKNSQADRDFAKGAYPGLWSELKSINEKLARIESQNRVIVIGQNALAKAVEEAAKKYAALLVYFKELLERPDQQTHAEHIITDFIRDKYKK